MRVLYLIITFSLLSYSTVYGQNEIVKDTLDWRGYYPLEVGNAWEWRTDILVAYSGVDLREIVGDTLIQGYNYFIQEYYSAAKDPLNGVDYANTGRIYLRYDTLKTRVMARSDSINEEWAFTCDLSADFGSTVECENFGEAYVTGEFATEHTVAFVGTEQVPINARKYFGNLGGGVEYYHGLGRLPSIGDGAQGGTGFTYAQVGSHEYGHRAIYVGIEHTEDMPGSEFAIFPNPAWNWLNLDFNDGTGPKEIEVYDTTGRLVKKGLNCESRSCRIDISWLANGQYFVRASEKGITNKHKGFIVLR